jgi:hypothetical protein
MPQVEASRRGLTRRDVLRRGAVAGGTLLWAAPVIQSIRTPAYAASPEYEACCQCAKPPPFPGVLKGLSCADCAEACIGHGGVRLYTRGIGCQARDQTCIPTNSCGPVPCAWESNGPEQPRRIKP